MQPRGGRWLADQQHELVPVETTEPVTEAQQPRATAKLIECLSVQSLEAVSRWSGMAVVELVARCG